MMISNLSWKISQQLEDEYEYYKIGENPQIRNIYDNFCFSVQILVKIIITFCI